MKASREGVPPGFQIGRDGSLWSTRALDNLMSEFYSSKGASSKRQVVHWHVTGAPGGDSDDYQTVMQHGSCTVSTSVCARRRRCLHTSRSRRSRASRSARDGRSRSSRRSTAPTAARASGAGESTHRHPFLPLCRLQGTIRLQTSPGIWPKRVRSDHTLAGHP